MPEFRFEFHEDSRVEPVVAEFPDAHTAREEALTTAAATVLDAFAEGLDPTTWMTRYYDAAGYLVGTVTYMDVLVRNRSRVTHGQNSGNHGGSSI